MIRRALLRQFRAAASPAPLPARLYPQLRVSCIGLAQHQRPTSALRWYATEPPASEEKKAADGEAELGGQGASETAEAEDSIKKELDAKGKEVADLKDKYLRSVADFRNLQERTRREVQAAKDFAIQQFAKDLVESVDNLDRALSTVPEEKLNATEKSEHVQDLVNLYEGLKMTETILIQTLKKHGLEKFDPSVEGEKFNPSEHFATFTVPMQGKEDNTVFHTEQTGWKLNSRVLRPAKVGVVKNS